MIKKFAVMLLTLAMLFTNMTGAFAFAPKGVEVVSVNDIPGIAVGHWTDEANQTGTTVIACTEKSGAVGGVSVMGGSPGTRETDLLDPEKTVQIVNAVVLSGGSAFGLDSATGVMKFMEQKGLGVGVGVTVVPIVSAAVLFDLGRGDDKALGSGENRPGADAGYQAAANAFAGVEWKDGNVGMSQDALAERLNVSRQAVSRWERDETMPETDKVVALADLFGVTTDYLLRQRADLLGLLSTAMMVNGFFFNFKIDTLLSGVVEGPAGGIVTGMLWLPALYGVVKIVAGILVLRYGKRYAEQAGEEER